METKLKLDLQVVTVASRGHFPLTASTGSSLRIMKKSPGLSGLRIMKKSPAGGLSGLRIMKKSPSLSGLRIMKKDIEDETAEGVVADNSGAYNDEEEVKRGAGSPLRIMRKRAPTVDVGSHLVRQLRNFYGR